MVVIILAGNVGAGKSTHLKLLAKHYETKGENVKALNFQSNNYLSKIFVISLAKLLGLPISNNVFAKLVLCYPCLIRKLSPLWIALITVDATFFTLLTRLYLRYNCVILIEDYVPALMSDLIYHFKLGLINNSMLTLNLNFLVRLIPRESVTVFLDADDFILNERWLLRGSEKEDRRYLSVRRNIYYVFRSLGAFKLVYLNTGNLDVVNSNLKIIEQINKIFFTKGVWK